MTTVTEACALELDLIPELRRAEADDIGQQHPRCQVPPTRTPPEPTVAVDTCGSSAPAGSSGLRLNDRAVTILPTLPLRLVTTVF
jgi:hypothetical protein